MKKIYMLAAGLMVSAAVTSCSKEECDKPHRMQDIPNIVTGTFPAAEIKARPGDKIVFDPELTSAEGVSYLWSVNGEMVSTDTAYTFSVDKPCRAEVRLTLRRGYATLEMASQIECPLDPSRGFILVGNKSIDFYDTQADTLYTDVYTSINKGNGTGGGELSATAVGERLFIAKRTNVSNTPHLFVASTGTLIEKERTEIGSSLGTIIPVNDRFGIASYYDGVMRLDLSSLTKTAIDARYGNAVYNGIVSGGRLFVNTTYNGRKPVGYYSVDHILEAGENQLGTAQTIDVNHTGRTNFVADNDGNVYTLGSDNDAEGHYIASISSELTVSKTVLPFVPFISGYSGGPYSVGMATDGNGRIYIPAADGAIYRYEPGNAASLEAPFIAAPQGGATLCGKGIEIDRATGDIFVMLSSGGYTKYGRLKIYSASGEEKAAIECGEGSLPQSVIVR